MSQTTHIVLDIRREDGTFRRALTPDAVKRMLNMLAANCKQLGVTFMLAQYCDHVIMMEVIGRYSHDMENNTWLRRQAEEFAKGYIAGLEAVSQPANSLP